jgi:hypothetical protein
MFGSLFQLGFSTHRKKRMRQIKKAQERGTHDATTDDPFELFISQTGEVNGTCDSAVLLFFLTLKAMRTKDRDF